MKSFNILTLLVVAVVSVHAANLHDHSPSANQHKRLSRRHAEPDSLVAVQKRDPNCRSKRTNSNTKPSGSSSSVQPLPTSSGAGSANNLIAIVDSNCGPNGATKQITATTGPNGDIDWLNCGINSTGGWTPPFIRVSDIITEDLSVAVQAKDSAFSPCSQYVSIFEQFGSQYGVPAIMLASFAMQESFCNPNAVGGAGEQGLMQLTADKCKNAPNGNCKDPSYNIQTGAKFFSDTLNSNGGDVLKTIGNYNGWSDHMTFGQATAAGVPGGPCCRCQNNLDYLHQFLNGWCQNVDAYNVVPPLGKYFNLNKCGNSG